MSFDPRKWIKSFYFTCFSFTWTLPCWSRKAFSFCKVFLFQISTVPFLNPQMMESPRTFISKTSSEHWKAFSSVSVWNCQLSEKEKKILSVDKKWEKRAKRIRLKGLFTLSKRSKVRDSYNFQNRLKIFFVQGKYYFFRNRNDVYENLCARR